MKSQKIVLLAFLLFWVGIIPAMLSAQAGEDLYPDGMDMRTIRKASRKGVNIKALSSVCSSTKPLSGILIKSQISDHISRGDPRASGYTLICGRSCVQFIADFYYCDGTKAGSFGYYGTWNGNGKARAYGGAGGAAPHSVSSISATARRKGCGNNLYVKTQRKAKSACLSWSALASRTGSAF